MGASLVTPGAASAAGDRRPAIEGRILQLINGARAQRGLAPYVPHAGLLVPARRHSQDQAAAGRLTHDGFQERVNSAPPDPAESNGAPDDGFWENGLAGCENLADYYKSGPPDSDEQVAQKFFDLWLNSPPHAECLFDVWGFGLNTTGIGLYVDSRGMWWATMEVARDYTPPSGAQPAPSSTSQPAVHTPPPSTPVPAPPATPKPTPRPRPAVTPHPAPTPAPATPVPAPATPSPDCRFDFWLLRVNRC